ncbi:hypothetical protein [Nocardiopsis sp. JB363]|uniref:hypothetical protein n=1 Tax=Nocardiopsis sp. JB363 TaxID=1434837 RepID=UPI00097A2B40|nr:hypothetical protein [Nocardiopsis sp. JB363]SIO90962.1 hypothetical protein BQ8420_29345 [Nocardiopsis sp. JB363]
MDSTASAPAKAPETPNPPGFSPARKRPLGAFEGVGHILSLWVLRLYRKGLLPTARSFLLMSALADIVDVDGRWCFYYLENLPQRCNGFLSVSSLKRAADDLIEVGLANKLDRSQTLEFFADDIARGRSIHRLPCVLELLVPAEVYPESVLAEINECRAALGEEPITPHSRPPFRPKTRAQDELGPSSDRATDSFPGDTSGNEVGGSVRDSASTGEEERQKQQNGPYGIIARIHDRFLSDPQPDRRRLTTAVDHLLSQGLGVEQARALFSGLDRLRRPFPALMLRMRSLEAAHAFLAGTLGKGMDASENSWAGPSTIWPNTGEPEPFALPELFLLDSQGKADETCPEHQSTRNEPGGACAICGRRCRSVPNELMHDPVPGPAAPPEDRRSDPGAPEPQPELPAVPEEGLDPRLQGLIAASLNGAGGSVPPPPPSVPDVSPWKTLGSGISPTSRAILDGLRAELGKGRAEGLVPPPRTAPHDLMDDAPTPQRHKAR